MAPYSLVISPSAENSIPNLKTPIKELPRCAFCQSYYTELYDKDGENWKCKFCNKTNTAKIPEELKNKTSFQVPIDDPIGEPILMIFLSLDFHKNDIQIITEALTHFITNHQDFNLILALGNSEKYVSLVAPPEQSFQLENGSLKSLDTQKSVNCAVVYKLRLEHLNDISPFIFAPSQFDSLLQLLPKLCTQDEEQNPNAFLKVIATCAELLPKNPLQVLSIIPTIPDPDSFSKTLIQLMVHNDIFIPQRAIEPKTPLTNHFGRLFMFTRKDLLQFLEFAISERPQYQCILKARALNCDTKWHQSIMPFAIVEGYTVFVPVITTQNAPLCLDIIPDGTDEIAVQITFKTIKYEESSKRCRSMLRVLQYTGRQSDSLEEISNSINIDTLIWTMLSRTFDKQPRDVVAALFRTIAGHLKRITKDQLYKDLTRAVCVVPFLRCLDKDRTNAYNGKTLMLLNGPVVLPILPKQVGKYYLTAGGVYCDVENDDEANECAAKLGMPPAPIVPIPDWCKENDESTLGFLQSL